jgi:hypothetical protein
MNNEPQSVELLCHKYVTKTDLFLIKRDPQAPYFGQIEYKYILEPPGTYGRTPEDIEMYWKYGNGWIEYVNGPRGFAILSPIVAVIPAGTTFRVTDVLQMDSFSIMNFYVSFYGHIDYAGFKKDVIEFSEIFSVIETAHEQYEFRINENLIEITH